MRTVDARRPFRFVAALGLITAALVGAAVLGQSVAQGQERVALTGVASSGNANRMTGPVRLTVEVNGDILVHSPVWERARAGVLHTGSFSSRAAQNPTLIVTVKVKGATTRGGPSAFASRPSTGRL
jgi:hypothetical protein